MERDQGWFRSGGMEKQLMSPAAKLRWWPSAGLMLAIALGALQSPGAPTTYHSKKVFRELIVQGERPEIAACMVAAVNHAHHDAKFDSIRWAEDVSESAYMRETEGGIHIARTVRFRAELRERSRGFATDIWKPAAIVCEQRDEESPEVRFDPAMP
jgi:hypothetical protein